MRLYDGYRLVDIKLIGMNEVDWSNDFYNAGTLFYHEELDAYEVDDIDYCIEQAKDWENGKGYFQDDDYHEEYRTEIEELDIPPKTKDGHYISVGDWLQDGTGIYMVWARGERTELKEVIFDDENSDDFHMGEIRILTREEIGKMTVC